MVHETRISRRPQALSLMSFAFLGLAGVWAKARAFLAR